MARSSAATAAYAVVLVPAAATVFLAVVAPFGLATIALVRQKIRQQQSPTSSSKTTRRSALCAGRVWHTRFRPVRHAFSYPIYIFCLDLDEVGRWVTELWPLSRIAAFSEGDHLKNGEGLLRNRASGAAEDAPEEASPLSERVYRLVDERTRGKFQPTAESHRILLVTHLRYYGYNFNPVSFYFVQCRTTEEITAVVGEVSNTPWNEMHCYVLHPDSVDRVRETRASTSPSPRPLQKLHYVFPKQFHVSPFMEMHYDYEWTFWNDFFQQGGSTLQIINSLRSQKNDDGSGSNHGPLQFTARLRVQRHSMHPYRIAWHMSTFPVYCAVIQVWIHYQAFLLFAKGVAFQPHPTGAETAASRLIGHLMKPFFAVQEWWWRRSSQGEGRHDAARRRQ